MSTRELAYSLIEELNENQLGALVIFIEKLKKDNKSEPEKPSVESLRGALHAFAKPELTHLEEGAWERDIAERIANGDESF